MSADNQLDDSLTIPVISGSFENNNDARTAHIVAYNTSGDVTEASNGMEQFKVLVDTDTKDVIKAAQSATALDLIKNDETVKQRVEDNAKSMITTQLDTESTKIKTENAKSKFDASKNACKVYGVEDTVPMWQLRMMKFGSAFWFVIYFFTIGTFVIAPISTFAMKLNVVFKKLWVALVVAVTVYLMIVLSLILIPIIT